MKVILLAPTPPPVGGMASWTEQMLHSPLKDKWDIDLVDTKMIGGREVYGNNQKRNLFHEIQRCLNIWKQLDTKLKDKDAVLVHSGIPSLPLSMLRECVCGYITRFHKRKFIIHFHCTVPNTTTGKIGNFILKKLCNMSDLIIVLNEQSKRYLNNITNTEVKVIPNFISSDQIQEKKEISEVMKTILYVGGVIESKGVVDMMKVAKLLPDIEFRFVGRVDENIKVLEKRYSLKNIIFTGVKSKENVIEELKKADVFMFLSYFQGEGFSIALTEAMAAGLPCIVTDWAANADMIDDGLGGFVVPVGDVDSVVKALKKITSVNVRKQQSAHNVEKAKNNYIASVVGNLYVDAYERCLQ